ncbi:MAG TPA: NAD(P)-dependent oxidoreductase [Candidatus Dormibacteraeota bacterium]|nr:NAD(P)-dependent oxidoreductase [Candidatus Dormibacteraeota bacterium]
MVAAEPGRTRVGFVGLGLMGLPMARRVLRAGFRLTVHNRTAAKAAPLVAEGAEQAATPAEAAERSDIVITMVTDSPDVEAVVAGEHGLLAGAAPGTTWIDMSTISPEVTRRLGAAAAAGGVECLDAPVSGGPPGAEAGTLSIMAGGRREVLDACRPLLQVMGTTIVHVGDLGAGQVTKACNQMVIAATLAGIAEALVLGARAGVEPALIREALMGGYAGSRLLEVHGERMIKHAFQPGFFVRLHDKDLHIVIDMARSLAVSAPVTAVAAQHFNALVADGDGELDNSAMVKVYERLARTAI